MVDREPQIPPSSERRSNAPAATQGAIKNTTGSDPYSMEKRGSRSTPVSTLTGQSGPPHRTATFAIVMPGWSRMSLMARISVEFTPTRRRIQTRLEANVSPMIFCWITIADILRKKQTPTVNRTAGQNPIASCALLTRIIPPDTYTGTPGMAGLRNITTPTVRKTTTVIPRFTAASSSLSQLRNRLVTRTTPTETTKKKIQR
mmetsp:Transcript_11469/g.21255  ORF Transcript_11469/g.21255 Transcript_11469/m.21255 type:complete len:202 (+) Transcript_11469:595-1200(+)